MFHDVPTRSGAVKTSLRPELAAITNRHVFLTCLTLTMLTQRTYLASNDTHRTLQISLSHPFQGTLRFLSGKESYLHVFYKGLNQTVSSGSIKPHFFLLKVPKRKFITFKLIHFEVFASCKDLLVTRIMFVFKDPTGTFYVRPCLDDSFIAHWDTPRPPRLRNRVVTFHSHTNIVLCGFGFVKQAASFNATIAITALGKNRRHNLVVSHQTKVSGTVTPYGFDGKSDYALGMDATANLIPPPGGSVMVSYPYFDIMPSDWCFLDFMIVSANGKTNGYCCGHFQRPPDVYREKLKFRFTSSSHSKGHFGFQIRFSFHGAADTPDKLLTTDLNTAVFNCSVPFYANFKQHLECNLDTECVCAEDEAECPFSRGTCEPEFLSADSKCYKYIKLGFRSMTWYDASALCQQQGLSLASFPTFNEERAFRDNILKFAFTANHFFFGLRTSEPTLAAMYREVWQWSSGIMAYRVNFEEEFLFKPTCAALNRMSKMISVKICGSYLAMHYLFCEVNRSAVFNNSGQISLTPMETGSKFGLKGSAHFAQCSGYVVHDFLPCDHLLSGCGSSLGMTSCLTYGSVKSDRGGRRVEVAMFVCDSQTQTVHYTQVCDHHAQCFDSSDENFCIHKTCSEKQCLNLQCVTDVQWCDGMAHCADGSDEACPQFVTRDDVPYSSSTSGLRVVLLDGHGSYSYAHQSEEFPACPQTHFLCANRELCLPVYLRCNGVYDCSEREDENNCNNITCSGYYRCIGSAVCVHSDHVCDGVFQCPQQDDELLCDLICPDDCLCQGLAFVCSRPFPVQNHSNLRYLDASGSGLQPDGSFHNHYLIRLVLSSCGLQELPSLTFPNLKVLDLSNNLLANISMHVFLNLTSLNFISLAGNHIAKLAAVKTNILLKNVYWLDLSYTALEYFESNRLWNLRNLKTLNLSHSMLKVIGSSGFGSLTQIESLDLRGTELREYPARMLQPLSSLEVIFSDVYKLCCQDVLPKKFSIQNCHTSPDEIASCKDLLRSEIYRMFLWVSCCFALVGNSVSFAAKIYALKGKPMNSYIVFINNLNVADFFMGLYLAVVGSADQVYRGAYLWHDEAWKTGTGCQTAGFFSLLSCEMSAFMICFITLDRFLVMRFPFGQLHIRAKSARVLCGFSWLVAIALATVPLLPITSDWRFYSQTGICIPLPVTRNRFKGHFYSFGILIVFNFVLFTCIIVGQLFIYLSIRDNSPITDKTSRHEATVARRLLAVVVSDFLCWFPIGLLGLMAFSGMSIPSEVNVALAVFALPLNSALNPFLYTFNLVMEKHRKASEQRLLKLLQSQIAR